MLLGGCGALLSAQLGTCSQFLSWTPSENVACCSVVEYVVKFFEKKFEFMMRLEVQGKSRTLDLSLSICIGQGFFN